MFLARFDGQSRFLVRALMSGVSGAQTALTVFHKQQRANPEKSLDHFIETLCQDEITSVENENEPLTVKPLVCLFSSLFKRNLLTFIYLVRSVLSGISILHLLTCLSRDSHPNPWVTALGSQLKRFLDFTQDEPLHTKHCSQRLKELSASLCGSDETGSWAQCFIAHSMNSESQSTPDLSERGTQRKRKGSYGHVEDADGEETGHQSKRVRMDACEDECIKAADEKVEKDVHGECGAESPLADRLQDDLPENIKSSFLQIKEVLESQTEWDENSQNMFNVLNECDPGQVEVFCSLLGLAELPEHTLQKLCNSILSLTPDLSYSTAATLIKSLLLEKVLSLSEPASRCLVMAVMSLCSHYPRPVCHAMIGPMLEDKYIGFPQAELLNRLMESCLDSHYKQLVLQMTFRIPWSEAVLSIIHSLLDSKPDLNEDIFTDFTEELVRQSPRFTKSVKFAKMMLTVLTKFSSHLSPAHKHSLTSCLNLNETFLKKSLQATLKRITNT
ncbi:Fanconi anemia group E protein isoform X1 [Nothobranchius furzeri]|uniref:Fanconi anemia, complementation group E n=2 Tax=Nothobranchius furzeri TaxID=105023 RepID=A0A1A8ATK0_NOTFU